MYVTYAYAKTLFWDTCSKHNDLKNFVIFHQTGLILLQRFKQFTCSLRFVQRVTCCAKYICFVQAVLSRCT